LVDVSRVVFGGLTWFAKRRRPKAGGRGRVEQSSEETGLVGDERRESMERKRGSARAELRVGIQWQTQELPTT
jgi:hypothetical protein